VSDEATPFHGEDESIAGDGFGPACEHAW
jgi:hypothetical protein